MKKVYVSFQARVIGLMEFEVSDDFKLSGKQADEIWEELRDEYPYQIETDILNDELQNLWGIELGGFMIDDMELDFIESVHIEDCKGNPIEEKYYTDNSPLNLE